MALNAHWILKQINSKENFYKTWMNEKFSKKKKNLNRNNYLVKRSRTKPTYIHTYICIWYLVSCRKTFNSRILSNDYF